MRVSTLHRRLLSDVEVMQDAIFELFPVHMPRCYETREMNLKSFVAKLNRTTEQFNVYNEINDDYSIPVGEVTCSGLWLCEDELPENDSEADVRILWHAHPNTRRVSVTPVKWARRRYFFWELLMHELVHRHQDTDDDRVSRTYLPQSTDRKTKEDQSYYGDVDEIEAYAHDSALEFFTWWPDLSVKQALKKASAVTGAVMPTACFYMSAFSEVPDHPAMRHFEKKLDTWMGEIRRYGNFYETLQLPKLCR